jgi:hypothetical protein
MAMEIHLFHQLEEHLDPTHKTNLLLTQQLHLQLGQPLGHLMTMGPLKLITVLLDPTPRKKYCMYLRQQESLVLSLTLPMMDLLHSFMLSRKIQSFMVE